MIKFQLLKILNKLQNIVINLKKDKYLHDQLQDKVIEKLGFSLKEIIN